MMLTLAVGTFCLDGYPLPVLVCALPCGVLPRTYSASLLSLADPLMVTELLAFVTAQRFWGPFSDHVGAKHPHGHTVWHRALARDLDL